MASRWDWSLTKSEPSESDKSKPKIHLGGSAEPDKTNRSPRAESADNPRGKPKDQPKARAKEVFGGSESSAKYSSIGLLGSMGGGVSSESGDSLKKSPKENKPISEPLTPKKPDEKETDAKSPKKIVPEEESFGTLCIRDPDPDERPKLPWEEQSNDLPSPKEQPSEGFGYREPEPWEKNILALEKGEWDTENMSEEAFKKYRKERPSFPSVFLRTAPISEQEITQATEKPSKGQEIAAKYQAKLSEKNHSHHHQHHHQHHEHHDHHDHDHQDKNQVETENH